MFYCYNVIQKINEDIVMHPYLPFLFGFFHILIWVLFFLGGGSFFLKYGKYYPKITKFIFFPKCHNLKHLYISCDRINKKKMVKDGMRSDKLFIICFMLCNKSHLSYQPLFSTDFVIHLIKRHGYTTNIRKSCDQLLTWLCKVNLRI